jgi:aminopeptidase 2
VSGEKFKINKIRLHVNEESDFISLNTLDIDIHSTSVSQDGAVITSSPKVSYDEDKQTTTFSLGKTLTPGSKASLKIDFTGILNDKLAGFYRSSYKHPDGTIHYLATTQMEPTDARRAFPCFDEPALKSQFTVTLIADKDHTCLSNMDQASEKEVDSKITGGKRKAVTFNKSPLMSTYLVAFIIGELKCIETNSFRLPVRVFSPPSSEIEHGRFSLELAAKTLAFYEKTFDSKYPLPKMDMVAIPDFSAGAMENWGLVTYRSVDLLLDESTSGARTKQRVAEVVQHELAHQWFGNLVTMDFWDGLWLNEGFATWMSWYSCNTFFPEWKIWESYVVDDLAQALSLDSLRSSHPIEVPVKRADEVNEIFDAISYSKGSAVIRMLSNYLGEETFMEGIRRYIKKHQFGNTRTEDLWASLAGASGKPVEEIMSVWTKKVGYPVISVTELPDKKAIKVKQNRFLRTGDVKPDEDQTVYPVFLEIKSKKGVDKTAVLNKKEQEFQLDNLDFFKLNADQTGIYRTSYSPERLEKLGQSAKANLLSVSDRAGLLADAGALSASGYQNTSGALALIKGFDEDKEFVVWDQMTTTLASIRSAWKFEDEKTREALKTFQKNLVARKTHELGWNFAPDEGHISSQFKSLLFGVAGLAGDEKVIQAAQDMFQKFAAGDRKAVHPNLRASVYALALIHGGDKEFDVILNEFKTSPDADERNTALRALGRVTKPELIKRAVALPLSKDVKNQDIYQPLMGLRSEPQGVEACWAWLTGNWDELLKVCPPGLTMLGTLIKLCTSEFATQKQLESVQAFFQDKDKTGYKMALEQSLDHVRSKIGWIARDRSDVEEFLQHEGLLKSKL